MFRKDEAVIALEDLRDRIQKAIEILKSGARRPGRNSGRRTRMRLSAAARRKISEGQKRRWAARKGKEKQD